MNYIIQWCNINQGFLSFALSLLTIFISFIALIMSYKIGRLPFKMKLSVYPTYYIEKGKKVISLDLVNQGNIDFPISSISVCDNKNLVCASFNKCCDNIIVEKSKIKRITLNLYSNTKYFADNSLDLNNKIKIIIYDINNNKYIYTKGFPVG